MIPTGRALLWALWLILGARAVLVQSQPRADWAGGSEGYTITARIPNKVWANIVKRDEPGLVGKTISPREKEEDKLVAPAAAELLEGLTPVSENERKDSLEEGREVDAVDQQKEDQGNDEDLAQEDGEDQNQELNQKVEQKQHSRDPGQDQNQAQKIKQVQNREQGEIQEIEGEEQQEESGGEEQGREEAQEQMQVLEEQRQGQGEEGQRQEENAGGLEKSRSLGRDLEQMQMQKRVKELQHPVRDQGQIQVQAVKQQAHEYQQAQKQRYIQVPWEGAQLQPAPPPEQSSPEQLLLEAFEQATVDLSHEPRRNDLPSPSIPTYESQQQQPPADLELSNTGPVPPPEKHLVMLAWGPWECHCQTGTMSRVREGKFLGSTRRLRSGALSRLQTQHQPCTYASCHCNQEKKECPSDHVSCTSATGACNHRASLTPLGSPDNTIKTAFWKQVQEGLEEVWVGLRSLVTKEKRIKRNQR